MAGTNVARVMKLTVTLEMGGRSVVEQVVIPGTTRRDWRAAISDVACRMELSTYGQPGQVFEMAQDDQPRSFANQAFGVQTDG